LPTLTCIAIRCGHCRRLAPDWQRLADDYDSHPGVLVADCDCTSDCKALCAELGVRGYPTIQYGAAGALQDYRGSRGYAELKSFVEATLVTAPPAEVSTEDTEPVPAETAPAGSEL
jgi:thiol-disulfide isomerase/thioredoxin